VSWNTHAADDKSNAEPLIVRFLLKDDLKQFVSGGQTIPDAARRRSDFFAESGRNGLPFIHSFK
jgi:hypothetical protein